MDKLEEQFYAIAAEEVMYSKPVKSVIGIAISEAMGDKEKIAALYIKHRVEQLKRDFSEELERRREEIKARDPERVEICPRCGTKNPPGSFRCKNSDCLDILPQVV